MSIAVNPWIKCVMDSKAMVSASFGHPLEPGVQEEFLQGPKQVGALVVALERAGHVRIAMHKHSYSRDADSPHCYKITAVEDLCLVPKVTTEGSPNLLMMSTWLQTDAIKNCNAQEIIPTVMYDKELNKLVPDVPGVFPKTPLRVRSGALYSLL